MSLGLGVLVVVALLATIALAEMRAGALQPTATQAPIKAAAVSAEPSASSTPVPEMTPSPSASEPPASEPESSLAASASPAHWYDLPPTPASASAGIKVDGGYFVAMPDSQPPYFTGALQNATVIGLRPDRQSGILWVEMATGGSRIARVHCQTYNIVMPSGGVLRGQQRCSYTGVVAWVAVGPNARLETAMGTTLIDKGSGQDAVARYLQLGASIPAIDAPTTAVFGYERASDMAKNWLTLQHLMASVGTSVKRGSRQFVVYSPNFLVNW